MNTFFSYLKFAFISLVFVLSFPALSQEDDPVEPETKTEAKVESATSTCNFSKEYITTLEYLREQKNFSIPEQESRKIAEKVSLLGCTSSAQRFIRITSLLSKAGLPTREAIQFGLDFSKRKDAEVQTFSLVFKQAFLEDSLDLDVSTSIHMASQLSLEFNGDTRNVREDFIHLLNFCLDEKSLNLPRPQCGAFAVRVAHLGEKFEGKISRPFIELFDFLRSSSGPQLVTGQALSLAEQLITGGRASYDNFTQAFKYGTAKQGLNLPIQEAVDFAKKMTLQKPPMDASQSSNDPNQSPNDKATPGT